MKNSTSAGVILAAGKSERFSKKQNKLRADFRGRPLICWSVDAALGAFFDEVVVVIGADDLSEILPQEATVIRNEDWELGQSCSLNVAVSYAEMRGHSKIVVGLADAPLISSAAWSAVAESPGPIATAVFGEVEHPPVKLENDVWPLLPLGGDQGAKVLMKQRPELVSRVMCEGDARDVDTPEDLKKLLKLPR